MEIKDLAGLSQPLTKLVEVASQGIGTLYEPIHIKRMAKARAKEIETITLAINDSNLPIQYSNGTVGIDTSAKEFMEKTERRMLFLEAKKQKNIEDIIAGAYENLETEQNVSEEPLQEEWINRFFNVVGEVSSDELKTIWSRILSEEIKEPGKCSIRTLESLRNISKNEAEIFKKVSNYIIQYQNVCYLPNEEELLEIANINYGEILKLDEAQLINSSSQVNALLTFNENNKENYLIYNDIIIFCEKNENIKIELSAYPLTEVGKNIFNILSPCTDKNFFEKYIDIIKNKMNISYSKILKKSSDDTIEYETPKIQVLSEKE